MSNRMERIGVLFVCTGNICRSPTAEGIFAQLVQQAGLNPHFRIDSAGISSSHVGEAPDPRTQAAARQRGVDLSRQRARKVRTDDLQQFHYLIAMDQGHYEYLQRMQAEHDIGQARLHCLLEFAPSLSLQDVPDPYYGPANGFQRVFDIVEAGCQGLLAALQREHAL